MDKQRIPEGSGDDPKEYLIIGQKMAIVNAVEITTWTFESDHNTT